MSYFDGFVAAVPAVNKDAYRQHASDAAPLFHEFGATRLVEAWGDDVPEGKINDFRKAVQAKDDEVVVFSFIEYPDKATRDAAGQKMMSDPRMEQMGASMPFDGKRMIYAGFAPIVDRGEGRGDYVDGFILPVPDGNKEAYRLMSEKVAAQFEKDGALRYVEGWGDDVQDGKVTDFNRAAHRKDGETVVFSYIEWPSKQVRDDAWKKLMESDMMKEGEQPPFDGKRMFWGGFEPIVDTGK